MINYYEILDVWDYNLYFWNIRCMWCLFLLLKFLMMWCLWLFIIKILDEYGFFIGI